MVSRDPKDVPHRNHYSPVPTTDMQELESPVTDSDVERGIQEPNRRKKGCWEMFVRWLKALFCCFFCCDDDEVERKTGLRTSANIPLTTVCVQQETDVSPTGAPVNRAKDYACLEKELGIKEKDNARLREELKANETNIQKLTDTFKDKEVSLHGEIKELRLRLSEMASERMRKDNPCVEDLNDKHRPTALADRWNSIFKTGEYWTTYEKLQKGGKKTEAEISNVIYEVCEIVYTTCIEVLSEIFPTVQGIWPGSNEDRLQGKEDFHHQLDTIILRLEETLKKLLPDCDVDTEKLRSSIGAAMKACQRDVKSSSGKLKEPISKLLRQEGLPERLQEMVLQAIKDSVTEEESADVEKFALELLDVCYRMRLHDIPMAVTFDFRPGSTFDPSLLEREGSAAKPSSAAKIKCVMRPPLLREEGGAVLSKGEVELESELKATSPKTVKKSTKPSIKTEPATAVSTETASPELDSSSTESDAEFSLPNVPLTTTGNDGKFMTHL